MAQAAYELERFAPRTHTGTRPRVRVAAPKQNPKRAQTMKMVRTLLVVVVLVVLVCGVLQTQAKMAELQSQITTQKKELTEQEALSAYLSFELENMSSLKSIEEAAVAMGFEKISNAQITYFRVDEENRINVRQNPVTQFFFNVRGGLLSIWESIDPNA